MKKTFLIISFILPILLVSQSPKQPEEFSFLDNISVMNTVYTLNSKINNRSFELEVCNSEKCFKTQEFSKTIQPGMLTQGLINFIKANFKDQNVEYDSVPREQKEHLGRLLVLVRQKEFEDNEAKKTEAERITGEIDRGKIQYSGKLIINKKVDYWVTDLERQAKFISDKKFFSKNTIGTGDLEILDSKIKFFNNKASSIYIKARLTEAGKDPEILIFLNNNFSVAVRYFNYYGNRVSAQRSDNKWVTIDYNDVFDYESDQFYNYSVANDHISLSTISPDSMSAKIKQRRFFDFFTAIVYSDVLSFDTENSNSLLNTQARLLLPLNLRNAGQLSFTRQLAASVNVALSNNFSDETRFIAITDDENFNHFELLKRHNLNAKLDFQAVNLEYKRLFMNISLGYSAAFYRTGFQYTQTDEGAADIVTNRQLLSLAHGPVLNFEIRPQSNFGADITIALEDLNYNDSKSINGRNFSDIIEDSGHNHLGVKYNLVNVEANFYWLTTDNKTGGVYTKLGVYYHTESYQIFPQIMVGYATNLTSFVNRFKPTSKNKNTE